MKQVPLLAILAAIFCGAAFAQQPNVVIWRSQLRQAVSNHPTLWCDGEKLARFDRGRYLELAMTPGHHHCVTDHPDNPGVSFDVADGADTQFFLMQFSIGGGRFWQSNAGFLLNRSDKETFDAQLKHLKPVRIAIYKKKK